VATNRVRASSSVRRMGARIFAESGSLNVTALRLFAGDRDLTPRSV
jgi:hypothetical protein